MLNWNHLFTNVIRTEGSTYAYWGNWSLDSNIKPGAVGILLGETGSFTHIGDIPDIEVQTDHQSRQWKMASHNVSRTEGSVNIDGSTTDPETGTEVKAGLEVTWGFQEDEGLISEFSVSHLATVKDPLMLAEQRKSWLMEQAKMMGRGDGKTTSQGFGFVSSVLYAKSGLNVGSSTRGNSFSVTGSISGVNNLVGASGNGKGSYTKTTSKSNVDLHVWPDASNELADGTVPIAFTFISFDGDTPLLNWRSLVPALVLRLHNGGTYIVGYELSYTYLDNKCSKSNSVSGGLTQTIGDIPTGATDLELKLEFKGILSSDTYTLSWKYPLSEWGSETCSVELFGVWAGATSVETHTANT